MTPDDQAQARAGEYCGGCVKKQRGVHVHGCVVRTIADALRGRPSTQWAYDHAWNALNKKFDELHQARGACEALRLELNTVRREVFLEKVGAS